MFASAIVALPVAAWRGAFHVAFGLIGLISVELVILATNRGRCPLTAVAARHTTERQPNFDIYLPVWLARWNKVIFARFSSVDCCSQGFSGCRGPAQRAKHRIGPRAPTSRWLSPSHLPWRDVFSAPSRRRHPPRTP